MMEMQKPVYAILLVMVIFVIIDESSENMTATEKKEMKEEVFRMFKHAYNSYMTHAYPADELMPLSCKGRYRGTEPSRGDVDETLGNFTLTLIDTLDTLVVVNEIDEFERAIKLLISDTKFDSDIVVSVFETNIRILGGLISGHVMASYLRKKRKTLDWYNDELLNMAKDVGNRLLPAFNTTTGIPYPRINLKYGITKDMSQKLHDTCTACAGSMILEFAALSRLTGEMIFEEKARKAMDYLWQQRHRSTDLMGLTINIHNGDWVRRESGVGAGIDSYYEYVYKAYILLGDDTYNDRFNTHYDAVMRYISQGPMLLDVHMHRPQASSRNFMDALLAFWPGLQVLKGDIGPAIETHEMLYQIIQKHHFLPEAFTTDFRVHWGHSPLRPEFVESTYFLYQATGDPHYLDVGKIVVQNLKERAQVPCGFASIRDVVSGSLEDQLDSFVFSETFKYLYLLFAEKEDLILNIEDYVFTTEAHLLPLSLSSTNSTVTSPKINPEVYSRYLSDQEKLEIYQEDDDDFFYVNDDPDHTCPNINIQHPRPFVYADNLRNQLKGLVQKKTVITESNKPQLKAVDFVAGNKDQVTILQRMGIRIMTMTDGRIQLLHTASEAASAADADDGMKFMQEMIELSKHQTTEVKNVPMTVQLLSAPYYGSVLYEAGPAQFGYDLRTKDPVQGKLAVTEPYKGCSGILNENELKGKLVVLERGECMFIDKARNLEKIGALGGIVIDHTEGSSVKTQPLFAMSGDGKDDVNIPMVFLFHNEGKELLDAYNSNPDMEVLLMFISKVHATVKKDEQSNVKAEEKIEPKQSEDISEDTAQNIPQMNLQPLKSYNFVDELKVAGTSFVRVAIDFGKIVLRDGDDESDVLTFDALPEGQVITFNLDRSLLKNENSPPVTQLYESVLRVLQRETNFLDLDNKDGMLTALARLLETAWFGFNTMDEAAEQALNRLSKQLKQVPHRNVPESNILKELEMKENCREDGGEEYLKTFAGGEECKGELHDSYVKNPWLKAVPPGHKMKETQAKVDKDGVLYIVDETIPKKQTLLPPGSSSPNSRESEFNRNFDSDTHTLSSIEMPNSQDSLKAAAMNQHRQESDSDINTNQEERHVPRRNKLAIDIQTMEVHVRTSQKNVDKPNKYINNQRTSQTPDKKDIS